MLSRSSNGTGADRSGRSTIIAENIPTAHFIHALERVQKRTHVSLAFGGQVLDAGSLALRHFSGPTFGVLPGVTLQYDAGLGGRSVALRRPIAVNDYFESDRITHHYDRIIRAEGLRSLAAAPVVLNRKPVGVLYAGFRNDEIIGGRIADVLIDEARSLEQELVTLQVIRSREQDKSPVDVCRLRAQIRLAHGELRTLGSMVTDPDIRRAIREIADKLTDSDASGARNVPLTERETDVLALVAAGLTNKDIADRLGLTLSTVKGYLKSIVSKLSAKTRLEAVVTARAAGMLP